MSCGIVSIKLDEGCCPVPQNAGFTIAVNFKDNIVEKDGLYYADLLEVKYNKNQVLIGFICKRDEELIEYKIDFKP